MACMVPYQEPLVSHKCLGFHAPFALRRICGTVCRVK
jgi:hypothetical protein